MKRLREGQILFSWEFAMHHLRGFLRYSDRRALRSTCKTYATSPTLCKPLTRDEQVQEIFDTNPFASCDSKEFDANLGADDCLMMQYNIDIDACKAAFVIIAPSENDNDNVYLNVTDTSFNNGRSRFPSLTAHADYDIGALYVKTIQEITRKGNFAK